MSVHVNSDGDDVYSDDIERTEFSDLERKVLKLEKMIEKFDRRIEDLEDWEEETQRKNQK